MTNRLKLALEGKWDTLHQRLFYALCADLLEDCNSAKKVISVKRILALVEEYTVSESKQFPETL